MLREGPPIKAGDRERPSQCSRLEVDQDAGVEQFSEELREFQRELVRRSVFIELPPGRSRHRTVTLRWQLRRVLLPMFGAALAKTDAIKWSSAEFKMFLTDPAGACRWEWDKRNRSPSDGQQDRQLPLDAGL